MGVPVYDSADQRNVLRAPRDIARHRELLFDLVRKDIRVRYRYAAIGLLWAVLQPLALMLVLTFVFSFVFRDRAALAGAAAAPAPYAVVLLCGLVFWQCFAEGLNAAAASLVSSQNLVKKVCFAREIVPLAALGYPVFNAVIGFAVLLGVHLALGGALHAALLLLPAVFAIQLALGAGFGLMLACGNALYRDIGYAAGVALVFGFYASPVLYPLEWVAGASGLHENLRAAYFLNPMAGLLTAYRQMLIEGRVPDAILVAYPAAIAAVGLAAGVMVFRRAAPNLSDHL